MDKKYRVLIIDDEIGLRDMLSFGLADRGYEVDVAATGEAGLESVRQKDYDIIVCDIMMPGMNGVEVLREIKQIKPAAEVIMATGYATMETAAESIQLGAFDYVAKPYGIEQLCNIFDQVRKKGATSRITQGKK